MIYTAKIEEAINIAIEAHGGQKRKIRNIPYIIHPLSVGIILARAGASEDVIVAGILHDVVEDSEMTNSRIEEKFGSTVADLVKDLTSENKGSTWDERKKMQREHIGHMSHDALLIKSADTLDNMRDIAYNYAQNGDKVFEVFSAPKEKIIDNFSLRIKEINKAWPKNPLVPELKLVLKTLSKFI